MTKSDSEMTDSFFTGAAGRAGRVARAARGVLLLGMNGRGSRKRERKSYPAAARLKGMPLIIFQRRFNSTQNSSSWKMYAEGRMIVRESLRPTNKTASTAASSAGVFGSADTGTAPSQVPPINAAVSKSQES